MQAGCDHGHPHHFRILPAQSSRLFPRCRTCRYRRTAFASFSTIPRRCSFTYPPGLSILPTVVPELSDPAHWMVLVLAGIGESSDFQEKMAWSGSAFASPCWRP